jgi:hypothetical protein
MVNSEGMGGPLSGSQAPMENAYVESLMGSSGTSA